jgi:outer membrane protein
MRRDVQATVAATALVALTLLPPVQARAGDNQGDTLVKLFGTMMLPSSDLKHNGGSAIDVDDDTVPTLSIAYFLTDHIALETICCFAQTSIYDRGLAGNPGAKLADTWIFPPTLSVQYHQQIGAFKPYAGIGVSFMDFFGEKSFSVPGIDIKNAWGLTLGAGVDVALGGGWQLSVDAKKVLNLNADIYSRNTYIDTAELDPWLISVGVGYRFNFSDLLRH